MLIVTVNYTDLTQCHYARSYFIILNYDFINILNVTVYPQVIAKIGLRKSDSAQLMLAIFTINILYILKLKYNNRNNNNKEASDRYSFKHSDSRNMNNAQHTQAEAYRFL